MIAEGGVILGKPKRIDPEVFFSNEDEEALDSFIISIAAWFNDLKSYQMHAIQAEEKAKKYKLAIESGQEISKELEMEARLCYSHITHAARLMASHLVELFDLIDKNINTLKHPTFLIAANNIPADRQQYLSMILRCATGDLPNGTYSDHFKELKKIFVKVRSNGTYHYYNLRHSKKGYQHFFKDCEGNEPYMCLADSPGGTRFFFADRIHEYFFSEIANYDSGAINEFAGLAQHAIKDLVESYVKTKEKVLYYKRIVAWTFKKYP